jgi:hypothetical protein
MIALLGGLFCLGIVALGFIALLVLVVKLLKSL